jgi:hypothetical protein
MKLAAVTSRLEAWELRGGLRSTRCGISCGQSQVCVPTVTSRRHAVEHTSVFDWIDRPVPLQFRDGPIERLG